MKNKLLLRLIIVHMLALFVFKVGVSATAIGFFVFFFFVRALGLTVAYHRYFAHRAFKTTRFFQFILALWGGLCAQRGPLWWASKHRKHHRHCDLPGDPHSPHQLGLWGGHIGWALKAESMKTDEALVKDFKKYPELMIFNKYHDLFMLSFAALLYLSGELIAHYYPQSGTSGFQILIWVYIINTLVHVHLTFCVNSIGHVRGSRPFKDHQCEKGDKSGNIPWLAWLTAGEGWHHNHHTFPYSARIGIQWFELDLGYLTILLLEKMGLIWDVKLPLLHRRKAQQKAGTILT
ncbi:fatty acid desaturase [Bacteriovorax sp. DB6_IX]|uniref:acyl-CoA desaturase n=1 Tax=Bacteriovorax sp. DB6_IX TaxID=1353530 RepID=UPI00038A53E0|nr:fatty acid desaturase [Bacteriovorax sp. DB6_IX]EQC44156.1 stearoyl-CoA 9-desaturase [Bacteriovorax sp. DB6_IX]